MAISIKNDSIDERAWGEVDKSSLKDKLKKEGDAAAIHETYAIVGDLNDPSTWKLSHHALVGNTLKLSRGGVHAAAQRLSATDASPAVKKAAAKHLLRHYRANLKEDPPESLLAAAGEKSLKAKPKKEEETDDDDLAALEEDSPPKGGNQPWSDGPTRDNLVDENTEEDEEADEYADEGHPNKGKPREWQPGDDEADNLLTDEEDEDEENNEEQHKDKPRDWKPGDEEANLEDQKDKPRDWKPGDEEENLLKHVKSMRKIASHKNLGVTVLDNGTLIKKSMFRISAAGKSKEEGKIVSKAYNKAGKDDNQSDMSKINAMALEPQNDNTIKCFKFDAASNAIDRQNDKFSDKGLEDIMVLCLGKPVQMDHNWSVKDSIGTLYDAYTTNNSGKKRVVQKCFIMRLPSTEDIIKKMDAGVIKFVSVSFAMDPDQYTCSACKKCIMSMDCKHIPGGSDGKGGKVYAKIGGVSDYFETSLVGVPAQADSRIGKNFDAEPTNSQKALVVDTIQLDSSGESSVSDNEKDNEPILADKSATEVPPQVSDELSIDQILETIKSEVSEDASEDRACLLSGKALANVIAGLEKVKAASEPKKEEENAPEAPEAVVAKKMEVEFSSETLKSFNDSMEKAAGQISSLNAKVEELAALLIKTAELQKVQTNVLAKVMSKPKDEVTRQLVEEQAPERNTKHWLYGIAEKVGTIGG